jgi:hypothetical protein
LELKKKPCALVCDPAFISGVASCSSWSHDRPYGISFTLHVVRCTCVVIPVKPETNCYRVPLQGQYPWTWILKICAPMRMQIPDDGLCDNWFMKVDWNRKFFIFIGELNIKVYTLT